MEAPFLTPQQAQEAKDEKQRKYQEHSKSELFTGLYWYIVDHPKGGTYGYDVWFKGNIDDEGVESILNKMREQGWFVRARRSGVYDGRDTLYIDISLTEFPFPSLKKPFLSWKEICKLFKGNKL